MCPDTPQPTHLSSPFAAQADPPVMPSDTQPARPSLSIDWEAYLPLLEDIAVPMEQKEELIETLWSIVFSFVDLGFDLQSAVPETASACGQIDDPLSNDPPDLLALLKEEGIAFGKDQQPWQE